MCAYVCVCVRVHAYVYVYVLVKTRGDIGYSSVIPYPSPLRQGLSQSLELASLAASKS